jgi:type IV secretion system protein TrbJ
MQQLRTLTATSQIGLNKSLKASFFGAALYFLTGLLSANAQWVVFDPTNYSKNIVTAIESVNATAQRSSAYVAQLQQYQTMLTNLKRLQPDQLLLATSQLNTGQLNVLKSVGDLSKLRDIQAIATEANSVAGTLSNATLSLASLKKLQQSLGGLNQAYSQRFEEARRMNLSWDQYAAKEDLQIRARVASAANRAQEDINRMDNVQKDYEFAQDMAAKIPQAEGVQQSMGIMNTQMNRVVTQLAQLNKGLVSSLNSKDPADVLAEEQAKQFANDQKKLRIRNMEIQRSADETALKRWTDSAK